jgi:manganese transport protein
MDPGNWATDVEAGAKFGLNLLFVVFAAGAVAVVLQILCVRLGLATSTDLAQACRSRYGKRTVVFLWFGAEVAIVAADLAEVLGSALALHLLFGIGLTAGVLVTAFDILLILAFQGGGFKRIEAVVLALVLTIAGCLAIELVFAQPNWWHVTMGFVPSLHRLQEPGALFVSIGIIGATVMPHNLYLHSSLVQRQGEAATDHETKQLVTVATVDTIVSLSIAMLINASIVVVAATASRTGQQVQGIEDAYRLLKPLLGGAAAMLFGVALLASGQSSALTGTLAGQTILEGFMNIRIPAWKRRLIARVLALFPALIGLWWFGADGAGINKMLVLSQVVLSFQLPFAIWPLLKLTNDRFLMGAFVNGAFVRVAAWMIFWIVIAANGWLTVKFLLDIL